MKELIDSILKAEQESDAISAKAKEDASKIAAQSALEIEEVYHTAEIDIKNAKKAAMEFAKQQADAQYATRMKQAEEIGKKMIEDATKKTSKAAEFIVGRILA